jgi:hypothetical protein
MTDISFADPISLWGENGFGTSVHNWNGSIWKCWRARRPSRRIPRSVPKMEILDKMWVAARQ